MGRARSSLELEVMELRSVAGAVYVERFGDIRWKVEGVLSAGLTNPTSEIGRLDELIQEE